ncbi:MAG: hypothetical protein L7U42_05930, partial [Candidatus Nanopelagicales bacterium]|nr:hypothetical protein [Candidatus Nanopelagicales bacterium]
MKKFVRFFVGLVVIAGASVGLAAPAHAAHVVHLCSDTSVEGNPGQTLILINGCPNPWYFKDWGSVLQDDWNGMASAQLNPGSSRTFTFGSVGSGSIADVYSRYPSVSVTVHATSRSAPASGSASEVKTVPYPPFVGHDWIQQVGVPASGSCENVSSKVGHWVGAPIG